LREKRRKKEKIFFEKITKFQEQEAVSSNNLGILIVPKDDILLYHWSVITPS